MPTHNGRLMLLTAFLNEVGNRDTDLVRIRINMEQELAALQGSTTTLDLFDRGISPLRHPKYQ